MGFVIDTINSGISKYSSDNLIIHSDRGVHYTHNVYQMLLKNNNIQQSMSAPATPRDNAPIESFFGHLKDELDYKSVKLLMNYPHQQMITCVITTIQESNGLRIKCQLNTKTFYSLVNCPLFRVQFKPYLQIAVIFLPCLTLIYLKSFIELFFIFILF